ncbi:MAG: hypothetical protein WBB64_10660 [Anaerolineales bacterium]
MENPKNIINLIFKVVALGMGIASIVIGFFPAASSFDTHITLLSMGLTALAVSSLMKE